MNDDSNRNHFIQVNDTVTLLKSRPNGPNECSTTEFMKRTSLK